MAVGFGVLLSAPDVGPLEQEYLLAALRSGWVAPAGPDLDAFEREIAEYVGVPYAVGLASGTAALHLAMASWGVGPGDVVPVSTLTFAATVNAIRYVGATPYFVDCEFASGNMNPRLLREAVQGLQAQGARVPVIISVDMLGKCVDYDAIAEIATDAGARLLCDSAEALGARSPQGMAGSFGDASVLSFNGNKIITTSGGGMLLTRDEGLAVHARKLATQAREPTPHYEHNEVGYNYRLSNLLAALGRAQLQRLDEMIGRRRMWRQRYRSLFSNDPSVSILGGENDSLDNCWLTAIVVDPDRSGWTSSELGEELRACGIETRPIWKPMHLQPVNAGYDGVFDGSAERLFENGLTLPSGSALTDEQFALIESVIKSVIKEAITA